MKKDCFEQQGQVRGVSENSVQVLIFRKAACASCHANAACTSFDKKDQIFDVVTSDAHSFKIGEEVKVLIEQKTGMQAVLIGFVVPSVILIVVIAVLTAIFTDLNQSIIALSAILCYALYCVLLYIFHKKIDRKFNLRIEHLLSPN